MIASTPAAALARWRMLGLVLVATATAALCAATNAAAITVTEYARSMSPGSQPREMTAGPDGNTWYTDATGSRIGRINKSGTVTGQFATSTPASKPLGITAAPDGNVWFAESVGAAAFGRVTPDGVMTEFHVPGFTSSGGIAVDAGGTVWVTGSMQVGGSSTAITRLTATTGVDPVAAIVRMTTEGVATTFTQGFSAAPTRSGSRADPTATCGTPTARVASERSRPPA